MLARLAWANVRSSEDGVRPYLTVVTSSVAGLYAADSLDAQLGLVVGGMSLPAGFGDGMMRFTLVLACVVGVACALTGRCVTRTGRRQLGILRMLGMDRSCLARLLLMEQGIATLLGLAGGLPAGVLLSHMLVFVTARLLGGHVEGFGPFLSATGLLAGVLGATMILAVMFVGTLLRSRGTGPRFHPVGLLAAGLACHVLSHVVFSLSGGRRLSLGPSVAGLVVCLLLLWLGTHLMLSGIAGILAQDVLGRRRRRARVGVATLTRKQVVHVLREEAGALAFTTVGMSMVIFVLTAAFGAQARPMAADGPTLVPASDLVVPHSLGASVFVRSYQALVGAFVLMPPLMTLMFSVALEDVRATVGDYLLLADLGCPRQAVERSVGMRVAACLGVPTLLSALHAVAFLLVGAPRLSVRGVGALVPGMVVAVTLVTALIVLCAAFTRRHCDRVIVGALHHR